ncbi:MAG: GNAT family N-acetyltransferase [Candidatus Latescibacteria bacterium]|nr:GNAT family N-acetyltransferase [Candidatus Latescibacterota bacterium]
MDINFSNIKDSRVQIRLRKLQLSDAKSIYQNVKDKAIVRYTLQIPHPYYLSDARKFINYSIKAYREKTAYIFGIEHIDKKTIIGIVSVAKVDRKNKNCELGYWLGKKYWHQGIASNAVGMILDFAFNKLKMHRVYASAFASNTGSVRVLEKNGFLLEGVLFENYWRNRKWHNLFLYGILKDNYCK